MDISTFAFRKKKDYKALWEGLKARNDHLSRDSARVDWILDAVESVRPDLILEVGCQTGGITKFLLEITPMVRAVDVVQAYLDVAESLGASTLLCFAEDLHQHNIGEYDSVVLTEVLNHAIDAEKVVANCWSKVTPGGNLVVTVPIGSRWTDRTTAREFNNPQDLMAILRMGTGYSRITIDTISHDGEDFFYACNLKKRARRGQ